MLFRTLVTRAVTRTHIIPRVNLRAISSTRYLSQQQDLSQDRNEATASNATSNPPVYPFAAHVVTRSHMERKPDSFIPQVPQVKHNSRGVMPRVDAQLTSEIDPNERITRLFSRKSPDCIPPGSIVMVESYLNSTKTSSTTFSGVLIAVRRAGIATTFVLRTIAHKLGVEMRFHAYSPMIKEIKVLQRADTTKRQPGLTRSRRAKLYYLRKKDDKRVASVANVVKQFRTAQLQQSRKDTSGKKLK